MEANQQGKPVDAVFGSQLPNHSEAGKRRNGTEVAHKGGMKERCEWRPNNKGN